MQTLETENGDQISEPTWPQIKEALDAIHPRDNSFVILSRGEGHYIQAAGAKLRLVIEVRRTKKPYGFEHLVLGRRRRPDEKLTSVNYSAGAIALFPSEVFSIVEAKEAFSQFFETGDVPASFQLRDVTKEQRASQYE